MPCYPELLLFLILGGLFYDIAASKDENCEARQLVPKGDDTLLNGVHVALVTPFDSEGKLNLSVVKVLVEHFLASGIDGFYVAGSTGEGFTMDFDERVALTTEVVRAVAGRVPVTVHVGACALAEAKKLARHAKEVGADAVSSVPPGAYRWLSRTQISVEKTVAYFAAVAGETDLPFFAYWLGSTINQSAKEFIDLMVSRVPNFRGIKYTTGDLFRFQQIHALSHQRGLTLDLLTGSDEIHLAGAVMGSDGAIGATYNVMPLMFSRLRSAFHAGRISTAMHLQHQVNRVISIMLRGCNPEERGLRVLNALKAIMRARGFAVGFPRNQSLTHPCWTPEHSRSLMTELRSLNYPVE